MKNIEQKDKKKKKKKGWDVVRILKMVSPTRPLKELRLTPLPKCRSDHKSDLYYRSKSIENLKKN